jgi:acyl transferase domain-containing protein/acyl carrier protein
MPEGGAYSSQDIAVVGMAARFPGARHIDEFWLNLRNGVESISFFAKEDAIAAGMDPRLVEDPNFVRACGVLQDPELFDAGFFGYNAREAEGIDPQQRLFLECCWHALEDAGCDPREYDDMVGVYAGCGMSTYYFQLYKNPRFVAETGHFQLLVSNDKDYLSTRTSYKLNLKGPSLSMQTACSTSLVAVHYACEGLLRQHCDVAIAGGSSIRIPQKTGYYYMPSGIYSPDGHCRAFDAAAEGTVFGHGVGVVVLKRLADALESGDRIHAVIRGSAVNNDGSDKAGYTAPSVRGQAEVVAMAHSIAEVDPKTITYIETHGTGTALGDPIEVEALTQAFRAGTSECGFCAIGSVKTNIGHLDSAAGIASLIKAIVALEHGFIPPSLHFQTPNPRIPFAETPFYVANSLIPWPRGSSPRRAGVSSFGIGGTNAHVVLEEAPELEPTAVSARSSSLFVLSATTHSSLEAATRNLADHLAQHTSTNLADFTYTLQVGRKAFPHRRIAVAHNARQAAAALAENRRVLSAVHAGKERPIVLMFSGQGSQYAGMGSGLYREEPSFRNSVDTCAKLLAPELGLDIRTILFPDPADAQSASQRIGQTQITQPALFVVEYALAMLLSEWGVKPAAMIGHSIGEYVAACVGQVFSLETALRLVAARGRLMQAAPAGAMIAVPIPEAQMRQFVNGDLSVACVNEPAQTIVSGPFAAIGALEERLRKEGIEAQHLRTSHAFHSAMMDGALRPFAEILKQHSLSPPTIPFISNVTGSWIADRSATDPNYWVAQLRRTVRFSDGIRTILNDLSNWIFVEAGPGQTLTRLVKRQSDGIVVPCLPSHQQQRTDSDVLMTAIGSLWLQGAPIDWKQMHRHEKRRKVTAPVYPFARHKYWIEPSAPPPAETRAAVPEPTNVEDWFYIPFWEETPQAPSRGTPQKSDWLVFEDSCGIGAQVASILTQTGQRVVSVRESHRFAAIDENTYEIDPRDKSDYEALARSLRASDRTPTRIAHFWTVPPHQAAASEFDRFQSAQVNGLFSLLYLANALVKEGLKRSVRIFVISTDLHRIANSGEICPAKATVLGACKSIPQEYSDLRCRSIEIELPRVNGATGTAAELLAAEVLSDSLDAVAGYRGDTRWVQTLKPVRLTAAAEQPSCLRRSGAYLITGGLGHIGLVLAEYLARTFQAKLILVGRAPIPERDEWQQFVSQNGPHHATSRKIVKLQALEELGSEVMAVSANIADQEQVGRLVSQVRARFGSLNGVIHAAGVLAPEAFAGIQEATPQSCELHFDAKVYGLLTLAEALRSEELDFFLVASSISSFLAGLGFLGYASANIFMDAFVAKQNRAAGPRWISINWDAWSFERISTLDGPREPSIGPAAGVESFKRVLAAETLSQVIVSASPLQPRIDRWIDFKSLTAAEAAPAETSSATYHARPDLTTDFVPPQTETERALAAIWQELLGLSEVGVRDNFFTELGGHSLLATQMVSRIRKNFEIDFPLRRTFDLPTISELAEAIDELTIARSAVSRGVPSSASAASAGVSKI